MWMCGIGGCVCVEVCGIGGSVCVEVWNRWMCLSLRKYSVCFSLYGVIVGCVNTSCASLSSMVHGK